MNKIRIKSLFFIGAAITSIIVVAALIGGGRLASAAPTNLIVNPSLETVDVDGNPVGWYQGGWGDNDRKFFYPVLGVAGGKAARVEMTYRNSGDAKWVFEEVQTVPDETYILKHSYRSSGESQLVVMMLTPNGYIFRHVRTLQPTNEWRTVEYPIVATNATSMTVFHYLYQPGYLEVDDFSLILEHDLDTLAPTVLIHSPAEQGNISGRVTFSVDASDNIGVDGVTYEIDGKSVATKEAPYEYVLDTTALVNGVHNVRVIAFDAAGNTAEAARTIYVYNPLNASENLIHNATFADVGGSGDPVGWFRGGYGNNVRDHSVMECDYYTIDDLKLSPQDQGFVFRPQCPVATERILRTHIGDYVDGDVKWFFADVPIGENREFAVSLEYQPYVYGANMVARYAMSDGSYQYAVLGALPQGRGGGNGYMYWERANAVFSVPDNAVSLTIFFASAGIQTCELTCAGPSHGELNIANISLATVGDHTVGGDNLDSSLVPNAALRSEAANGDPLSWHRGNWGSNDALFSYPVQNAEGGKAVRVELRNYIDGDAKWYFDDIRLQPGQGYTFTHAYRSTVPTQVIARNTHTNGEVRYVHVAYYDPTNVWTDKSVFFVQSAGVQTTTLFHVIASDGWLETAEFDLVATGRAP